MTSLDPASRKRARLPSVQDGVETPPASVPTLDPISPSTSSIASLSPPHHTGGDDSFSSINFRSNTFSGARVDRRQQQPTSAPTLQALSTGTTFATSQSQKPATNQSQNTRRGTPSASFRNVSACNRCRVRKNRCDQRLPACQACEKAGAKCVGYDPFLGKEIPRSYVYFLESRISHLESVLQDHGIEYSPADDFHTVVGQEIDHGKKDDGHDRSGSPGDTKAQTRSESSDSALARHQDELQEEKIDRLVSDIGMVSVQGASDPRYLGSTSGISFARVVFNAVKSTVSRPSSERGGRKAGSAASEASTMRDSIFGLHSTPNIKPAPFPDKDLGLRLVDLYFEHANPQIPSLHRGEFMALFERVYVPNHRKTSREAYLLNIVYAIGAGIIFDSSTKPEERKNHKSGSDRRDSRPSGKKARLTSVQYQPEEYHASAIVHLEGFLASTSAGDRPDGYGGGLEELQAVLLLAGFALLRPVAPGLWYIVGVAMRLGVDLGLHYEGGADINASELNSGRGEDIYPAGVGAGSVDDTEIGRRQWVRDLRRRLWWCVYSLDRLVSTVVGRPFSISDQVVTTSFPSLKDDTLITTTGIIDSGDVEIPSYKHVAHHYFRLRLLQSEIVQVLQYQGAQKAHVNKYSETDADTFMHNDLPSPFLHQFITFGEWRKDMDRRLWMWKQEAPTKEQTGVSFNPQFLELNYWQAVILLYRQSVTTPAALANDESTVKDGMESPHVINMGPEDDEDEDFVYLKIAEAGQKVLKIYRHLHRMHLVNYTYLATHHLFMAGISFLYAIWYSTTVRTHLTLDDVDSTILATLSVLSDLTAVCPPAQSCKDAFDRMSRTVLHMAQTATGFGQQAANRATATHSTRGKAPAATSNPSTSSSRYHFDMDLGELFTNDNLSPVPSQQPFYIPPSSFSNTSEMSFLDNYNFPLDGAGASASTSAGLDEPRGGNTDSMGVNGLGVKQEMDNLSNFHSWGIGGIDGTHDWSESSGTDFFGGFFFGGGTT